MVKISLIDFIKAIIFQYMNNSLSSFRKLASFLLLFLCFNSAFSQLDTIHYFPPFHAKSEGELTFHYLYLSTPETTPFDVTITDGQGNIQSVQTISVGNPAMYKIGDDGMLGDSKIFLPKSQVHTVLSDKGLIAKGGSHHFFAELRVDAISYYHASAYTAKGTSAAGKLFRVGLFPQMVYHSLNDFSVGIMSLEDNNLVYINDFNPGVTLETPNSTSVPGGNMVILLNKGETYVITGYMETAANFTGFLGAQIQSTGNIVVSNGNFSGSIHPTSNGRDYGMDQMVSINKLGTEYVVIEGNGVGTDGEEMERPIVIAHYDNTSIYVNGSSTPLATINGGDYFEIPNANYQGTPHRNMLINTSKPAYVIQALTGSSSFPTKTGDFNLIPPIHCRLDKEIDAIPSVNQIGTTPFTGAVFVITTHGSTVQLNGVTQTGAVTTAGGMYDTYRIKNLSGNQKITSTGALQAGIFGYSSSAAYSAFYSGFNGRPAGTMELQNAEVCQNGLDSLIFKVKDGTAPYSFNYSIGNTDYTVSTNDTIVTVPIPTDTTGTFVVRFNYLTSMDVDGLNSCNYQMFDTLSLIIHPTPEISPLSDTTICFGENVILNATTDIPSTVTWNPTIINGNSVSPPVGDITYIATATLNGCSSSDTMNIHVNPSPNANFVADTIIGCFPFAVTFTPDGNSIPTICSWDFGDGNTSSNCGVISHTFDAAGTFNVTLQVEANGCTSHSDTVAITSKPYPTMDALSAVSPICEGESIVLNATGTGTAVVTWNTTIPNGQSVTPQVGNNPYIVTVNLNGCLVSDTLNVQVNPTPSAQFTTNTPEGCLPFEVVFTANPNTGIGTVCSWDFGDGNMSNDCNSTTYTYETEGVFDVTLVVESDQGCKDSITHPGMITTHPSPSASFTASAVTMEITSPHVVFTNTSTGGTIYSWSFGDGSGGTSTENTEHTFPHADAGTYQVILTVTNEYSCVDTAGQLITLLAPKPNYQVPNVFTPNNDGQNDVFELTSMENIKKIKATIVNRWGNPVFESDDTSLQWNGKVNNSGSDCSSGTYFYTIVVTAINGEQTVNKGFVHLIR